MNKRFFTNMTEEDWHKLARQLFNDRGGRPAPAYDNNISNALSEIDITLKLPEMWAQFEALKHIPAMVLRGENSDLLSAGTVEEMARRHPRLTAVTIHAQGHAPLLTDRFSMGIIADFLREPMRTRASSTRGNAGASSCRASAPRSTAASPPSPGSADRICGADQSEGSWGAGGTFAPVDWVPYPVCCWSPTSFRMPAPMGLQASPEAGCSAPGAEPVVSMRRPVAAAQQAEPETSQ